MADTMAAQLRYEMLEPLDRDAAFSTASDAIAWATALLAGRSTPRGLFASAPHERLSSHKRHAPAPDRLLFAASQSQETDEITETERAGFEPAMEFNPHTRLAGECLQPLGHLS